MRSPQRACLPGCYCISITCTCYISSEDTINCFIKYDVEELLWLDFSLEVGCGGDIGGCQCARALTLVFLGSAMQSEH